MISGGWPASLRSGAKVLVANLPPRPDGWAQGPDDFLAEQGAAALLAVLDQARPAYPPEAARAVDQLPPGDARVDAANRLIEDPGFLAYLRRGGEALLDLVAREFKPIGITKAALKEKTAAFARLLSERRGPGARFLVQDGRLHHLRRNDKGEMHPEPLANFTATIVQEIIRDDGATQQREFEISGKLADGTELRTVRVPAEELAAMDWIPRLWGARAIVEAGARQKDELRQAVQVLFEPTERQVFGHTGFRQVNGQLAYLHQGGAVGAEGVTVEVKSPPDRFALPSSSVDARQAVQLSLRMLDCGPPEIMIPLLAVTYLGPLVVPVRRSCTAPRLERGPIPSSLTSLRKRARRLQPERRPGPVHRPSFRHRADDPRRALDATLRGPAPLSGSGDHRQ